MFASALLWVAVAGAAEGDDPRLRRFLARGNPAYLVQDHRRPMVWVRITFGVSKYDAWWVDHQMEVRWPLAFGLAAGDVSSATVAPWSSPLAFGIEATARSGQLDTLAEDLIEVAEARVPDGWLPIREQVRRARTAAKASVAGRIHRAIATAFYHRKDPRRWYAKLERFRDTTGSDLVPLLRSAVRVPDVRVGLAGDVTEAEAKAFVRTVLGEYGVGSEVAEGSTIRPLLVPRHSLVPVDSGGAPEVMLVFAREGLAYADPLAPAASVAEEAVRRRLVATLRQGRGDTYHVGLHGAVGLHRDVLSVTTTTSPARAMEHRAALLAVLDDVSTNGLDAREIEQARARFAEAHARPGGSPGEVLASVMWEDAMGDHGDGLSPWAERLAATTDAQIVEAAKALFAPEGFVLFAAASPSLIRQFETTTPRNAP